MNQMMPQHPIEVVIATDNKAEESIKARAREMLIEAIAAQLYTIDRYEGRSSNRIGKMSAKFWRDTDGATRARWRDVARRKLKTGEIFGWPK